jgi:hypothetical protein
MESEDSRVAKIHYLKTWPHYFKEVVDGIKTFEIRKNDRDFRIGDVIILREWNKKTESFSGKEKRVWISYVMELDGFGLKDYVAMSIVPYFDNSWLERKSND